MSFAWMRRIDYWVGTALCRGLALLTRQPLSLYGDAEPATLPRRVICSRFFGLGNSVLALPLLKSLKEQGVTVGFWSFEGQAELARLSGLVDEVFIIRPSLWTILPSLFSSLRAVRRFGPEAFLDLEPSAYFSAILSRLSGAPFRVGFLGGRPVRERLYTHLVSLGAERHRLESNLALAQRLGFNVPSQGVLPDLPSLDGIRCVLPDLPGRRRIVININSSDQSWQQMWPVSHWVALCNRLLEDYRVDLVFPGTAAEKNAIQELAVMLRDPTRVFNIAGDVYLVELLKVLHEAILVVSVDSGTLQMAAWVQAPIVALFGPQNTKLFGPRTPLSRVISAGLSCTPCIGGSSGLRSACQDNQCMKKILPEQVYAACSALLESHDAARVARKVS